MTGGERTDGESGPPSRARSGRAFALLGAPVSHSLSPAIHGAAFRELGIDASYTAVRVGPEGLAAALREWAALGGGNVTLPHKERAARALERPTEAARACGACNCFWRDEAGRLAGDNTDVGGFLAALEELPEAVRLRGGRVLILGAGGGAAAVLHACLARSVRRVDLLNRTVSRALRLAASVAPGEPRGARAGASGTGSSARPSGGGASETRTQVRVLRGKEEASGPYDLVVNATRLGLRPSDPLPLRLEGLEAGGVFDLVYAPGGTEWSRRAAALGIPASDGLGMLVHQAALSLRCWFPEVEPPLESMRAAARRALSERDADPGAEGRGER